MTEVAKGAAPRLKLLVPEVKAIVPPMEINIAKAVSALLTPKNWPFGSRLIELNEPLEVS